MLASVAAGLGVSTSRRVWATPVGISRATLDKTIGALEADGLIRVHASKGRGSSVKMATVN